MNSSGMNPDRLKGSMMEVATIIKGKARHVPCALKDGEIVTIKKAWALWSPSTEECQSCLICQP